MRQTVRGSLTRRGLNVALLFAVGVVGFSTVAAANTGARMPASYKNCTALHKKYPHGLGKAGARDQTGGEPVTTFRRSTKLYNQAMNWNKRLDADKDGIACEAA